MHSAHYGHATREEAVEVVTYRLSVIQPVRKPSVPRVEPETPRELEIRPVTLGRQQVPCTFAWRAAMSPGETIVGPAVIEEATSTTFVPRDWRCTVDELTNLRLERIG
jgi:N-methylhydantoinase A